MEDHGRGLFIIAKLMDSLELRIDGGLEVRMTRACVPSRAVEPAPSGSDVGHKDARTRAMLEEIEEAFFALDWQYRYVYVNEMALRFTRSPATSFWAQPWEALPQLAR